MWSVNPDDDSVSVIRTDTDVEVQRFRVGQEPQSIALDPNNRYVYVANAADNSVSVISLTTYIPPGLINGFVERTFRTGAEPWNIVISPDGKRVYVANSGQDTIRVIQRRCVAADVDRQRRSARHRLQRRSMPTATTSRAAWR